MGCAGCHWSEAGHGGPHQTHPSSGCLCSCSLRCVCREHRPAPPTLQMGPAKISGLSPGLLSAHCDVWAAQGLPNLWCLTLWDDGAVSASPTHPPQALPVDSSLFTSPVGVRSKSYCPQAGQGRGLGCRKYCNVCWSGDLKGRAGSSLSWEGKGSKLLGIGCKRIQEGFF